MGTSKQEGPEVCETGLWVAQDGSVVDHPVTGSQLVPPGSPLTADRVAAVEAARAAAPKAAPQPEPAKKTAAVKKQG